MAVASILAVASLLAGASPGVPAVALMAVASLLAGASPGVPAVASMAVASILAVASLLAGASMAVASMAVAWMAVASMAVASMAVVPMPSWHLPTPCSAEASDHRCLPLIPEPFSPPSDLRLAPTFFAAPRPLLWLQQPPLWQLVLFFPWLPSHLSAL